MKCAGSLNNVEGVQELQWTGGRAHRRIGDVQIAGGSLQFCVAEQDLNGAEIYARIQQVSGEGVSQRVRMNSLGDTGLSRSLLTGAEDGLAGDRLARFLTGKSHSLGCLQRK